MERRRFLGLTAAGAFATVIPSAAWCTNSSHQLSMLAEPELIHILSDRDAVRKIGRLYRRAHPIEDDAGVLRRALMQKLPRSSSEPLLKAHLDRVIREDFEAGRTVQLDGWVLARTEAHQCALYEIEARSGE